MIDLHCHSHFSDGKFSPEVLLEQALHTGVSVLALTDHDTIEGLLPLHRAAQDQSITIINGIELSTRWKKYDIHILGLNFSLTNTALNALVIQQNESRIARAKAIGSRLTLAGIDDAYEKACQIAGHDRVARPHFAAVLVQEGKVIDIQTAFKRYLKQGKPAYVPTAWISVQEAVEVIVQAGGQAVIAHPFKYDLTRKKLLALINDFKEAGGVGMEVVSGELLRTKANELARLCVDQGLLASTGSDYHGHGYSRVGLGQQQALPAHCTPIWTSWTLNK